MSDIITTDGAARDYFSLFCYSLWCPPDLSFDFEEFFCQGSIGFYQLVIDKDRNKFFQSLYISQLVEPIRLDHTEKEAAESMTKAPRTLAFI